MTIHLHANAMLIDTDPNGRHVERIRAGTLAGSRFSVVARSYVIAAGGIENARLLLVSDGAAPRGVGNDRDQVGRHFMEHPRFRGGVMLPTDPERGIGFYGAHRVGDSTVQGYLQLTTDAARREGLSDVYMRLSPIYDPAIAAALDSVAAETANQLLDRVKDPGELVNELDDVGRDLALLAADLMTWQQAVIPGGPLVVPLPEVLAEVVRRAAAGDLETALPLIFGDAATAGLSKLVGGLPLLGIGLLTAIDQVPNPESRITLSQDRDAMGMRRAQLDWQLTDLDRYSVVRTLELLGAELARIGLGRLRIDVDDDTSSWPDDLAGGWHHMGTTRMSDDPSRGVVDRDCRVHEMDNLYIAGSSVFTTAGSGTPTMTLVALALRLADNLRESLR